MMIFESEDQPNQREFQMGVPDDNKKRNTFLLSEDQKNNLNKRLPRGFCLIKKQQYQRLGPVRAPHLTNIVYQPIKIERQVDLGNPIMKTLDETWNMKKQEDQRKVKFLLPSTIEGRSRQSQKIKNIIQRFRKLIKNTAVQSFLNKIDLMSGLNQIESQNKKGLLTIDAFKDRYTLILQTGKKSTFETQVANQMDEMIEQFQCYVEQARKVEFENSIQSIQKSIDKITRYLSETTDAKTQGNWYIKKKKKGQRNDTYNEKQITYFGELIRKLPTAYLAGVWQIAKDRPFSEAQKKIQTIHLNQLGPKKIRDIEIYVKGKLSQLYRSRERKKEKIQAKLKQKLQKANVNIQSKQENGMNEEQQKQKINNSVEQDKNPIDDLDDLVLENFFGQQYRNEQEQKQSNAALQNQVGLQQQKIFKKMSENDLVKKQQDKDNCKIQKQQIHRQQKMDDSMDDNSSDSSFITDEDDSDF